MVAHSIVLNKHVSWLFNDITSACFTEGHAGETVTCFVVDRKVVHKRLRGLNLRIALVHIWICRYWLHDLDPGSNVFDSDQVLRKIHHCARNLESTCIVNFEEIYLSNQISEWHFLVI